MAIVKEKQQVYTGLTVSDAEKLLASSKEPLYLCIGNIAGKGVVYHSGDVVSGELIDPAMVGVPISKAHPKLPSVVELSAGLQLLDDNRQRWDSQRQPRHGEVFDLADETRRLAPNFARNSQ